MYALLLVSLTGQCDKIYEVQTKHRSFSVSPMGSMSDMQFVHDEDQKSYSSTFATNLWIGGTDASGNLKLSAATYDQFTPIGSDYTSGPINETSLQPMEDNCNYFGRVWLTNNIEISTVKQFFLEGNLEMLEIPKDILEWPAIGNPHFDIGSENGGILQQVLAPFYDHNSDGIYNPFDGDLPVHDESIPFNSIEEVYVPDLLTFNVYNDKTEHLQSDAIGLSVEIRQINYAFECDISDDLNHTVFTNYTIINRSAQDVRDFKIAIWEDNDLACFDNDHIGCSPQHNASFTYNEFEIENTCSAGIEPFQYEYGLIQNTILLNKELQSYMFYNNGSIYDGPPATADPQTASQYYNLISALWLDGTPLTEGGSGYDPSSMETIQFAFPDLPNDPDGWSLYTEFNLSTDRRTLSGIKTGLEDKTFLPGQILSFDVANNIIINRDADHISVFDTYAQKTSLIRSFYSDIKNDPAFLLNCQQLTACTSDCVWPGDANRDDKVDGRDFLYIGAHIAKGWTDGLLRETMSGNWEAFNAFDWNGELVGINAKYADCDGNGIINAEDFMITEMNLENTNPNYSGNDELFETSGPDGIRVEMLPNEVAQDEDLLDRFFAIDIYLDDLASEVFGVSFEIEFDSSLVAPNAIGVDFNASYFGGAGYFNEFYNGDAEPNQAFALLNGNRIIITATSIEPNASANLDLFIAKIGMTLLPTATTQNADGRDTTSIKIYNLLAINEQGESIELPVQKSELILTNLEVGSGITSSINIDDQDFLEIYPVPTSGLMNVQMSASHSVQLELIDVNGLLLNEYFSMGKSNLSIDLTEQIPGVYFLKYTAPGKVSQVKRIIKI